MNTARPFADVRILDFTQILAGPYGTYQLALPAPTLSRWSGAAAIAGLRERGVV